MHIYFRYSIGAKDHGNPSQNSSVEITITILDENLHKPDFLNIGPIPIIPEVNTIYISFYFVVFICFYHHKKAFMCIFFLK